MKKKNFIALILGTLGGLLFALGLCMCLLPEWNAFTPGVVMAVFGLVILIIMLVLLRKASGKPAIKINARAVGILIFGILSALILGVGMCMTLVWNMMLPGIVIGVIGILLLLCLIPMCKGLK